MPQTTFSPHQLKQSFDRFKGGHTAEVAPGQDPNKAQFDAIVSGITRDQERVGSAGHQADWHDGVPQRPAEFTPQTAAEQAVPTAPELSSAANISAGAGEAATNHETEPKDTLEVRLGSLAMTRSVAGTGRISGTLELGPTSSPTVEQPTNISQPAQAASPITSRLG